jgi:hypothetical protein
LLQLEMPEQQWQANTTRLALQLMSAGARAVYQGQLPLQLAASLDLGCVAAVAPAARSRQLGEGFDLRELQVKKVVVVVVMVVAEQRKM